MNKVYLITKNEIVYATTLDKEVAKKFQLYYSDQWEKAKIEEWHLEEDNDVNKLNFNERKFYTVKRCYNGNLEIINEFLWDGYGVDQYVRYDNGFLKINVLANTKEEALKKAEDEFNRFEKQRWAN